MKHTLWLALVASVLLTGCAAPDPAPLWRALGLEQPVADRDLPPPATLAGVVGALGMGQVSEVSFVDPYSGQTVSISNRQQIAALLSVLRQGAFARPEASSWPPQLKPLRVEMRLAPGQGNVILFYNAQRQALDIYNVPTRSHPNHIVATYVVPDAFGQALYEALGIDPPHSSPHA